jgi:hypothetical protein
MQFIEQSLQKSHLPHSFLIVLAFSEFNMLLSFSVFSIFIRVKKGQGNATDPSGFSEIVVDAEEHLITLLNPPKVWNLK